MASALVLNACRRWVAQELKHLQSRYVAAIIFSGLKPNFAMDGPFKGGLWGCTLFAMLIAAQIPLPRIHFAFCMPFRRGYRSDDVGKLGQ